MSAYEIITICIFSLMLLVWTIIWVRFDIRNKETHKFYRRKIEEWLNEEKDEKEKEILNEKN